MTPSFHDHTEEQTQARQELVKQAGHKKHRSHITAMIETGQLSGTRFTLERVAYNEILVSHLIQTLQRLQQLPVDLNCAIVAPGSDAPDDAE